MRSARTFLPVAILFVLAAAYFGFREWQNPERHFRSGQRALADGDFKEVETAIARLDGAPKFTAQRAFLQGALLVRQGRFNEALEAFQKCHDHPDLQQETLILTGQALYQTGRPGNAKLLWEQVLAQDPKSVDAHRWLGVLYFDVGAMDQALEHLSVVSELAPTDPRPDRLMGLINKDYERPHLAVKNYRESLRRDPNQPNADQVRLELAECEIQEREFDAALDTLQQASPSPRRDVIEAECLLNLGNNQQARQLLDRGLTDMPGDLRGLMLKNQLLLDAGELPEALACSEELVKYHPYNYNARFQRVQTLRRANQTEQAEAENAVAEKLREKWFRFYELNGQAAERPTDVAVRYELGNLAEELGRTQLARTWYESVLAIDPKHSDAIGRLAKLNDTAESSAGMPRE